MTDRTGIATVRCCARQGLSRFEHPAVPILAGKNREPSWPDGVVGSLMHGDGYRAAAVTNSLGIASRSASTPKSTGRFLTESTRPSPLPARRRC
ncbi:hypothetical protein ACWCPF_44665 [Streptomyces sp. NPDC001858]